MMQAESAEIQVQQRTKQFITPYFEEEGPDDEFRPVKISIVTTTTQSVAAQEESRDEGFMNVLSVDDERETIRESEPETRETEKTEAETRESAPVEDEAEPEAIEVQHDSLKEEPKNLEESGSYFSELTKSKTQESSGDDGEKGDQDSSQNKNVSLFDTSLLDEEDEEDRNDAVVDADDLSVVSKSVVDESKKNVEEAEALAEEMKRQLEESLAQYTSTTPNPSLEVDEDLKEEGEGASKSEQELSASSSSVPAQIMSKSRIELDASDVGSSNHLLELPVVNATPEMASGSSVVSSSSSKNSATRRSRSTFRQRRPSTLSWANADETAAADGFARRLPITQRQEELLETIVIPAVFLVVAVAICRTFFHSWLKVGNGHSTTWALTWMVLCIIAVVAPVCALEYLLLGGFLAGTVVQEALAKYPEVKRFLRDVRRMRLKAGWWYPSEVRTLRRDLEVTNAELLSQQSQMNEKMFRENEDERSIRRQMSREEHRKEKVQLEKIFDVERSEWCTHKEELIAEKAAQIEENARLQTQLETEQQKQMQIAAQKEQLENNIEVERAQWKFSRLSLEDALKAAVAAQKDSAITRNFFEKMEAAHEEERLLWEKEREGFQSSIKQAELDAIQLVEEHVGKLRLLDEMRAFKQTEWETERKSLQEAVKKAIDEAKEVQNDLDSQICKLMDADDEKFEKEVEKVTEKYILQKESLEQMLEDVRGEQEVTSRCVQNLQSVLEEERAEWKIKRETLEDTARSAELERTEAIRKLEQTERVFEEERATWETARRTFEEALEAANSRSGEGSGEDDIHHYRRAKKALYDELKSKESKIKALEESIAQFENILAIQERVELSTKATTHKRSNKSGKRRQRGAAAATREAGEDGEGSGFTPVAYVVPQDGVEVKLQSSLSSSGASVTPTPSFELSSSGDAHNVETRSVESASYYSWVRKIQETHGKERKQLLRGMLSQHVRWRQANHHVGQLLGSSQAMLEASSFSSDDSDGAENFHGSIVRYNSASMSAKSYMEEIVSITGLHEDFLEVRPVPSLAASSFDSNGNSSHHHHQQQAIVDVSSADVADDDNDAADHAESPSQRSTRSVAVVANPWLKNAPVWQQVWSSFFMARLSPFRLCRNAVRTVCSGVVGGTLGTLGLLHLRRSAVAPKPKAKEAADAATR